jgi:hypothetical protein
VYGKVSGVGIKVEAFDRTAEKRALIGPSEE